MKNKAYIDGGIEGIYQKREEFDTVVEVKESISEIQNDEKNSGVLQLITDTLRRKSKKVNINAEQQPNTHSKSLDLGADNVVQDQYPIYFLQNSVNEITQKIVNTTFNQNIENTEQILVTFKTNKINKTNESFQDDGYVTMAEIQEERKKYLQSNASSEQSDYMNMDGCKTQKQPEYANCTFFRKNTSENIVTDNEIIVRSETASLSSKL